MGKGLNRHFFLKKTYSGHQVYGTTTWLCEEWQAFANVIEAVILQYIYICIKSRCTLKFMC